MTFGQMLERTLCICMVSLPNEYFHEYQGMTYEQRLVDTPYIWMAYLPNASYVDDVAGWISQRKQMDTDRTCVASPPNEHFDDE